MKSARTGLWLLAFVVVGVGVVAIALAGDGGASAPSASKLLAGNGKGLWIIDNAPAGGDDTEDGAAVFSIVAKESGGKWKRGASRRPGRIMAAAAVDQQVHVIRDSGGYLVFGRGAREEGIEARSLEAGPRAITAAPSFGPDGKTVLLAVGDAREMPKALEAFRKAQAARQVASKPASKPAPLTRPATAPAASRPASPRHAVGLLVLAYVGKPDSETPWHPEALLKNVEVAPDDRVLVATIERRIYVLLARPGRGNELHVWKEGKKGEEDKWDTVSLTREAATSQVLGMWAAGERRVIALAKPTGGDDTRRELALAVFSTPGKPPSYHRVKRDNVVATWPHDALPAIAGLGAELALFWKDGQTFKTAPCDINGELGATTDVEALLSPIDDGQAAQLHIYLIIGLMIAIFAVTFIQRPQRPFNAFDLLPDVRPALMWRRIMAATIDILPFSMLAGIIFMPPNPPETFAEMTAEFQELIGRQHPPDNYIYSHLLAIGLYTAYSTVMELRFGWTLGKRLMKLRVVGHAGAQPSPRDFILRNLVRTVPLCLGNVLVTVPLLLVFPLLNRWRQRLGDMLARTAVIDVRGYTGPPTDVKEDDERFKTYLDNMPLPDTPPDAPDDSPPTPPADEPPAEEPPSQQSPSDDTDESDLP